MNSGLLMIEFELHRLILGLGRDPDIFGIGALLVQFNFLVLVAWLLAESLGPQ